ncbi:glycosyltransferase family 2 protein [Candidatus Binatia bacterium]|nr:glycosyltransferase family 2 protein [Candidatus Binatia bacterium]
MSDGTTAAAALDLSVVVPFYEEEEAIDAFFDELLGVLDRLPLRSEVIAIDDGSGDHTFDRLAAVRARDPRVKVIRFRRNFGQTAGLAAGFAHASGAVVVTMDGDLQNDPADIPRLLAKLDEGYDVVSGWRHDRQDDALTRVLPSRIANGIISSATNVQLHDYGCGIKAYRREITTGLKLYGEMHRFLPAIAGDLGARVTELPVNHRPRTLGRSKYGLSRTVRVVLDLMTVKFLSDFSTRPIQVFGLLGLLAAGLGGILMLILGFERIFLGMQLADRPIVLLAILLVVTGLQFITFGLLGEMLARTYHESQGKPIYVIRDLLA